MDDARLAEIETRYDRCYGDLGACECQDDIPALIAEVRRLQVEVEWLRAEGANLLLKFGRQIPNDPPRGTKD